MNLDNIVKKDITDELPLFHKLHKHEMFLLSCVYSNSEYKACALLPEHHYFCDHTKPITDLMFILECARQAETYIVHKYEHQSIDTRFILTEWSCEFSENFIPIIDLQNKNIILKVSTDNSRRVKNKIISQEYKIDTSIDNVRMATICMSVKYMTNEAYHKIRNKTNNNILLQGGNFFEQSINISPEYIYRRDCNNVVVRTPEFNNNKVISTLAVNKSNTAYFDHEQDHYPAMVLMEAGKQNCQLWISNFNSGKLPVLTAMKSCFSLYAEFDKDVQIISEKVPSTQGNKVIFNVLMKQGGVSIAEMAYSFEMIDM